MAPGSSGPGTTGVVITGETVVDDLICCEGDEGWVDLIAGTGGEEVEEGDRNGEAGGAATGVIAGDEAREADWRRRDKGRMVDTGGGEVASCGTNTGGSEDSIDGSRDASEVSKSLLKVTAVVVTTVFVEGM